VRSSVRGGLGTLRAHTWWALALALLLVGAGSLFLGLKGHEQALPGPATAPKASLPDPTSARSAVTTTTPSAPPATLQQFALRSTPVRLSVPAIALNVSLSTLGLNANGTVQVPTNIQQPGWYRVGPSPGQDGSAVILGHVDSYQGPAVFFKLRSLVPGDLVNVSLADGASAQFKVTFVTMYSKTSFPDQEVYGGQGHSSLQLVTCGGAFDSHTGHYLSNIVVFTSLVALTSPEPVATSP
jgi:Sortase domain